MVIRYLLFYTQINFSLFLLVFRVSTTHILIYAHVLIIVLLFIFQGNKSTRLAVHLFIFEVQYIVQVLHYLH